jgi:thiamine-monophosphate kinase
MTTIRDLGEKTFIREVLSRYAATARADAIDDCVVIDLDETAGLAGAPLIVYSIDHPPRIDRPLPPGMEWRFHGRWVAGCTANDVLAMGARPCGMAVDLAVPPDADLRIVDDFCAGLRDVVDTYGARLEGGNTEVRDQLEVAAMCWGWVPRAGLIRRRGARPGDVVAVTAELGLGWSSYLLRRLGRFDRLSAGARRALEGYNLMPLAPHRAILETVRRHPGALTSGMDITDGVCEFLHTIREASGHGAALEEAALGRGPVLQECARLLDVPPPLLAVEYGYDTPRGHAYTVAPDRWPEVVGVFRSHGAEIVRVGQVTAEPEVVWVSGGGERRPLPPFWDDKCERGDAVERWLAMVRDLRGS